VAALYTTLRRVTGDSPKTIRFDSVQSTSHC